MKPGRTQRTQPCLVLFDLLVPPRPAENNLDLIIRYREVAHVVYGEASVRVALLNKARAKSTRCAPSGSVQLTLSAISAISGPISIAGSGKQFEDELKPGLTLPIGQRARLHRGLIGRSGFEPPGLLPTGRAADPPPANGKNGNPHKSEPRKPHPSGPVCL